MKFSDKNIIDEELNKFKKERPIYSRFVNLKIRLNLYFIYTVKYIKNVIMP